ncbi:hypothetical protein QYM36_003233 [Artemia franciscana]|uniref:Uncharacterized protein n=1 Tax=Artemia franciscana TaxID=6661 RepID=A0AA88LDZ1_ARTSF|nr:hypothetical protein QYM36_003233 [Artemia franciscana]
MPSAWKTSLFIPVFKRGNRKAHENYRLIALVSALSNNTNNKQHLLCIRMPPHWTATFTIQNPNAHPVKNNLGRKFEYHIVTSINGAGSQETQSNEKFHHLPQDIIRPMAYSLG